MADLPFEVPFDGDPIMLDPDAVPELDGHEQLASFHVGEPWSPPPWMAADAVTIAPRLRLVAGRLEPWMYEVTFWRAVSLRTPSVRLDRAAGEITDGR